MDEVTKTILVFLWKTQHRGDDSGRNELGIVRARVNLGSAFQRVEVLRAQGAHLGSMAFMGQAQTPAR